MEALVGYLEKNDPGAAKLAKQAIHCFEPFGEDPHEYARAQIYLEASCKPEVVKLLSEIRKKAPIYDHDPEAALNTEQNAHIAVNAEEYYSNMIGFNDNTWNLRDTHMIETLNRIFQFYGKGAKGIVWEHNTHIGDARYTDMRRHAMHNTGQLAREQYSEQETVLVGFGSYGGTVMAGEEWGAPMEAMKMPDARLGSWEEELHSESTDTRMLIFDRYPEIREKHVPHRAIGVVYNPKMERHSNYVPSIISRRYDAFIYIDQTKALHPMHLKPDGHLVPETYPFNF
jgi:erythromycin esterase-like protein